MNKPETQKIAIIVEKYLWSEIVGYCGFHDLDTNLFFEKASRLYMNRFQPKTTKTEIKIRKCDKK